MISSLDPRSKLFATLAAMIILIALDHGTQLVAAWLVLIMIVLFLHLGRSWLNLLKGLAFAVGSFFVIAWVAFDSITAIVAGLRLVTLGTVFFLFFQTTSPEALSTFQFSSTPRELCGRTSTRTGSPAASSFSTM